MTSDGSLSHSGEIGGLSSSGRICAYFQAPAAVLLAWSYKRRSETPNLVLRIFDRFGPEPWLGSQTKTGFL